MFSVISGDAAVAVVSSIGLFSNAVPEDDGVCTGKTDGRGDPFKDASALLDGRYSHTVSCFTQFAQ